MASIARPKAAVKKALAGRLGVYPNTVASTGQSGESSVHWSYFLANVPLFAIVSSLLLLVEVNFYSVSKAVASSSPLYLGMRDPQKYLHLSPSLFNIFFFPLETGVSAKKNVVGPQQLDVG